MSTTRFFAKIAGMLVVGAAAVTIASPAAADNRAERPLGPAVGFSTILVSQPLSPQLFPSGVAGCTNGVSDQINGHAVCIHIGGKCVAAHNAKYRVRGYTCVNGRLRRLTKPAISVGDASVTEGNSGTTTLSLPVTLSSVAASTVTVDYATADGTATAGSDYSAANGTLRFRPGETRMTIAISVFGDTNLEPDETVTVTLSNAVNAKISKATATATIKNDDTAVPITAGSYKGATQNGNYVFFTLNTDRTVTGFRVNDLPESCDLGGEITGGIDFGKDVFHITSAGQLLAEGSWTGSNVQGDVEWTSFYAKIVGVFGTPTSISGTLIEKDELNYKGQHYQCSSGEITWSATHQG
jgi:hypothetical protein